MTNVIQMFCCIFLQTQKSQQPTQPTKAWKLLRKNRRKSSSLLNLRQKLHQLLITPNWTGSWTQQVLHLEGMIYDLCHKKQNNWFKTLVSVATQVRMFWSQHIYLCNKVGLHKVQCEFCISLFCVVSQSSCQKQRNFGCTRFRFLWNLF